MEDSRRIAAPDPPPAGVRILAFERGDGWRQATYCPADDNPSYQPDAWQFIGAAAVGRGPVTHWLPFPLTLKS